MYSKNTNEKYSATWLCLSPKSYDTGEAYSFNDIWKWNLFFHSNSNIKGVVHLEVFLSKCNHYYQDGYFDEQKYKQIKTYIALKK